MTFSEKFKKAQEAKKVRDVSFNIFQFKNPGDTLIGELIGFEDFKNPKNPNLGVCQSYKFMTDDGPQSCVLGSAADKVLAETVKVGDLCRITYIDTLDLGDGRSVNRYQIEVVPAEAF